MHRAEPIQIPLPPALRTPKCPNTQHCKSWRSRWCFSCPPPWLGPITHPTEETQTNTSDFIIAELLLDVVLDAIAIENGILVVRESEVPDWFDREQFRDTIKRVNSHILDSSAYLTTMSDLVEVMESYDGDDLSFRIHKTPLGVKRQRSHGHEGGEIPALIDPEDAPPTLEHSVPGACEIHAYIPWKNLDSV